MRDLAFTHQSLCTGEEASKLLLFDEVEFAGSNKLLLLAVARPENGDLQFFWWIGPKAKVESEGILATFSGAAVYVSSEGLLAHFQTDRGANGGAVNLACALQLHGQPFI